MRVKNYWKPTPFKWRALGDTLLYSSGLITTYAILNESKVFSIASLLIGTLGKCLTNFFTDEPQSNFEKLKSSLEKISDNEKV
jgi:hypothetical protein